MTSTKGFGLVKQLTKSSFVYSNYAILKKASDWMLKVTQLVLTN